MARFKKGDRVRLSGKILGVSESADVEGRVGTVEGEDSIGVKVTVDGPALGCSGYNTWRFNHSQVDPLDDDSSPIGILGKAAKEILEHHVSAEDRDFDTLPQCYMTVGDMRELVRRAKEEEAL